MRGTIVDRKQVSIVARAYREPSLWPRPLPQLVSMPTLGERLKMHPYRS